MQNVVNLMRGSVRVEVVGAYPERFMNMCAENEIAFWDLERIDSVTLRITMSIGGYNKMRPLLGNVMCTAKTIKKEGAPFFFWRLRKRYALFLGFIAVMAVTWIMSLYIWDISVTGNREISSSAILEVLDSFGVGIGSYGPAIKSEALRNEVLLKLPDLAWITVQVNGSKATVVVRERVPVPEMIDNNTPNAIVAEKSGVIEKMNVFVGLSLRAVGDTVTAGDDIVGGVMDSISSGSRLVSARGEIYARTWYELSAQMPLKTSKKIYTGNSNRKVSIIFGGNRINLYINSGISYTEYDKIVEEKFLTLPGEIVLPIKLAASTYNEYEKAVYELDKAEAEDILRALLMKRLEDSVGGDGEIKNTDFDIRVEGGIIKVTLNAECSEQIGTTRELTEEEKAIPYNTEENPDENGEN